MEKNELEKILAKHQLWVYAQEGGERAILDGADLHDINLCGADLRGVSLCGANLEGACLFRADLTDSNLEKASLSKANLSYASLGRASLRNAYLCEANLTLISACGAKLNDANLAYANLTSSTLRGANLQNVHLNNTNLSEANLCEANLSGANLCGANLSGAILLGARLDDVEYDCQTSFFALQCPEEGSFIGFKKAQDKIVKLRITENAKRSSATTRKCRCSEAEVLDIFNLDGSSAEEREVSSNFNSNFIYKVGETVKVYNFDEDRWKECSTGIHFFMTFDEAVQYKNN